MSKLFGPYGLTEPLLAQFTGGLVGLHGPNYSGALSFLAACKAARRHVIVGLVGGRNLFTNADGSFSLSLWEAQLSEWAGRGLEPFIADGTIVCARLMDEPQDTHGNWGGHAITPGDVAGMAAYSRSLFPALKVSLGTQPGYLQSLGLPAHTIDVLHTVYHQSETPQATLARDLPLCAALVVHYVVGLNVLNGGLPNGQPMTAAELLSAGSAFLKSELVRGLLLWQYDAAYFAQPDVATALAALGKLI